MKYKPIDSNYKDKKVIDAILDNRKITKEDVDKLLNAGIKDYKDPFKITGMRRAVDFFKQKVMEEGATMGLLVDPDV